jgi:hypothetical protein
MRFVTIVEPITTSFRTRIYFSNQPNPSPTTASHCYPLHHLFSVKTQPDNVIGGCSGYCGGSSTRAFGRSVPLQWHRGCLPTSAKPANARNISSEGNLDKYCRISTGRPAGPRQLAGNIKVRLVFKASSLRPRRPCSDETMPKISNLESNRFQKV